MRKQYHVLNGDALGERFPEAISGELLVARECLVDGPVKGHSLTELFATRAEFLSQLGTSKQHYYEKSASEFLKMLEIPPQADIHLWFEDDLFCQVNCWFVVHLLRLKENECDFFLVRPTLHTSNGFGALHSEELHALYQNRTSLKNLSEIGSLWTFYQQQNKEKLLETALKLESQFPFILPAVMAHLQRFPVNGETGRPQRSLQAIMLELKTKEFTPIFKEFCKRESIYGFGDLQVKRLFDELEKRGNELL